MKRSVLYLLLPVFVFLACETKPEKVKRVLVKKTVFVIPVFVDSSEKVKTRFLEERRHSSYIEYIFKGYDLVDIHTLDSSIKVDLKYADTLNFLRKNMYDGLQRAYFTCDMALKISAAQFYLRQADPNLTLVVLDASRPQHIQQLMWDSLKMNPVKKLSYLSSPEETSLHNYGCAIDATIMDKRTGSYLDMGTPYDYFDKLAQPVYEAHFLKTGQLSKEAYENRKLLRAVMKRAKLNPINSEWWHFSMCSKAEAAAKYPLIK